MIRIEGVRDIGVATFAEREAASPRFWAHASEERQQSPAGQPTLDEDQFSGYAVMGLPFASGHVLAMRRFPDNSVGPAYTSVWHRRPDGRWTFYSTLPPGQGCSKYFSNAIEAEITAEIRLTWLGPKQLRVVVDGPRPMLWDLRLRDTPVTRLMNASGALMPASWWRSPMVLDGMGKMASVLMGAGRMSLTGRTPNGHSFIANPQRVWMVEESRATVNGVDLGRIGPLREQARLDDVWIPQRGVFAMVRAFLRADAVPAGGPVPAAGSSAA